MAAIHTRENEAAHRYEILVDGTVAGHVQYNELTGARLFAHTEIDPAFEGQGLAGKLAKFALDDLRARTLQLVPACQFIAGYVRKHPEYLDLVRPDVQRAYNLV